MPWLLALLVVGATYRLTRLVNADYVTRGLRTKVYERDIKAGRVDAEGQANGPLSYFVDCPWCVSMYAAIPPTVAAVWWPDNRAVWAVLLALTASAAVGLVTQLEDDS